jgi:3-oxoacyl-[acyl-carrier protein] reductase
MTGPTELAQDIALVTGASRGIGRAIALELGHRGATVVGTATSEAGAQSITDMFTEAGVKGRGLMLNVATQASVDALLGQLEQGMGAPTILVNNAGITRDNLLLRMKPDEWDEIINTNLGSVYRMSKGVLRGMMKASGHHRLHQIPGARGRLAWHYRECRGTRLHRDRYDRTATC